MVDCTWVSFHRTLPHVKSKCYHRSGLLARMKWHRVVLDEAQFIRNRCVSWPFVSINLFYFGCIEPHGRARWLLNFVLNTAGC